MHTRLI